VNKKVKDLLKKIDDYLALPNVECARVERNDYDELVAALFNERERFRYKDAFVRNGKTVKALRYGENEEDLNK